MNDDPFYMTEEEEQRAIERSERERQDACYKKNPDGCHLECCGLVCEGDHCERCGPDV